MKQFFRDLLRGPKFWGGAHGLFLFGLVAIPLAVLLTAYMWSQYDLAMRDPNIPLGKVIKITRIQNRSWSGPSVYTDVVTEKRNLLVNGNFNADSGMVVYLGKAGFAYQLCASGHECVSLVPEGE